MTSGIGATGDIIEELVHQFSDPFAFYRELIQNSIDAGSTRVDVTIIYGPDAAGTGLMTVRVSDWGEGMNREIIETYLLTKFRSSKEDDLTKIGKFGIGFLSVFAPEPDLVVVETGRDGEDWRLVFHPDRTYDLLRCPEPVEGTRVVLHKQVTSTEYRDFVKSSRDAIVRWCRHSEVDITFAAGGADGSAPGAPVSVRESLAVDTPLQVEFRDAQNVIVAGPSREIPPQCGFYNRGLTLWEGREEMVPGVSFKVVSDLLEHTLTRDNVRRDRGYSRVIGMVDRLVKGPLRQRLPEALKAAAGTTGNEGDYAVLLRYALTVLDEKHIWLPAFGRQGAVEGRELRRQTRRSGRVLGADVAGPLVGVLVRSGATVLRTGSATQDLLSDAVLRLTERKIMEANLLYSAAVEPIRDAEERALAEALPPLLGALKVGTVQVTVARVVGEAEEEPFVRVSELQSPVEARDARRSPFSAGGPPVLCLNRAHATIEKAVALARLNPGLAALLCSRALAVSRGRLGRAADQRLTKAALSA